MKVFGYCRAAEQANSGPSLEAQRQQINHYATIKGWLVAECFMEAGSFGFDPVRALGPKVSDCSLRFSQAMSSYTAKLDNAFRATGVALDALEQLKEKQNRVPRGRSGRRHHSCYFTARLSVSGETKIEERTNDDGSACA